MRTGSQKTDSNEPTIVVQKAYDWTLWIIRKVEKFPRSQRYSIGEHLVRSSVDLLMHLVDATYQTRNTGSLSGAVREVNRIRYLVRLAKDLRLITIDSHEFAAKAIDEIGRRFRSHSFASRKGFGQHRVLEVARTACTERPSVVKGVMGKRE